MISDSVLAAFRNKNILVTGGTGLIGRQIVDILKATECTMRIVSLDAVRVDPAIEHVRGDLTDFAFCMAMTQDMDFVFHIAGIGASVQASENKMASHFVPMLMMNTNVLEACRRNKVEKAVYTSSVGAYAPAEVFRESEYRLDSAPMDFAGWAKRMAEAQILAYKLEYKLTNFAVVRPSNVYGPGDNFDPANSLVIPSLLYRLYHKENPLVIWGDGTAIRDFAYSRDIAEGIILALHHGTPSGFVNLGSGAPCSIKDLVETLHSFIAFRYTFDPSKPRGAAKRIMDLSLARETIHYNPTTTLKEGLMITWEWFNTNPSEYTLKQNYFTTDNRGAHA